MSKYLDKIDYKILQYLDFNARVPHTQIAKQLKISKKSVEYRIKQLEKESVIQGYYSLVNIFKLGYIYGRIFMTLKDVSRQEREEIIRHLQNNKKILWLFEVHGKYDLGIVPLVKTHQEFKEVILELRNKFGSKIKKILESITTKLYTTEYSFLEEYKKSNLLIYKDTQKEEIDTLDTQILRLLAPDARISLVELGFALNQSPKTISYRIKQLEKKDIIQSYRIITDKSKFKLDYYKILINLNSYTKDEYEKIKKYLLSYKNVIYFVEEIGLNFDLDFEILTKSNEELYQLIEDLRYNFPNLIEEYEIVPLVRELKTNFFPF